MIGDQDGGGGEEVLGRFKTEGDAFLFSDHENERKDSSRMEIAKVELHQLLL